MAMNKIDLELMREKYKGCLVGLAIGDALGVPVEGFSQKEIEGQYGRVTDYIDSPYGIGAWTDDTSMTLAIAESYLQFGDCRIDDIAKRFIHWYKTDGRGIGITIKKVLDLIDSGTESHEAAKIVWESSSRFLAPNGALMRCAPIALARINDDEKLISETTSIGLITHADPRSTDSCILYNLLLADLIRGIDYPIDEYKELIENQTVKDTVSGLNSYDLQNLPNSGYVIDTIRIALWMLANCDSFEDTVITAVNLGGDADTNAAVAGALAGAKYGYSSFPSRLPDKLQQVERITLTADMMFDNFCSPSI
jgi:ADP-ribosyl-[dinitrogen reductase] hydrolase